MFSLPLTPNTNTPSPPSTTTTTTTTTTVPTPVATAEKTHGIAIDEPSVAHQAILFILDVLIRNNQAMPIVKLYDSFADRTFSPQMLRAVGGNEQGLQQFLLRYPSLFTVANDTVSANSATPVRTLNTNGSSSSSSKSHHNRPKSTVSPASNSEASETNLGGGNETIGTSSTNNEPMWDAKTMREIEQEALTFFKKQLSKREEEWLPIVSVAGHASQASPDVRKYVGPQNEFKIFLQRYPHVFIVKEDFCGLKGKADQPGVPFPPPSPPPKRRITLTSNGPLGGGTNLMLTRSTSFKSGTRPMLGSGMNNGSMPSTPTSIGGTSSMLLSSSSLSSSSTSRGGGGGGPSTQQPQQRLTSNEVKAVHYVMRLLHKNGRVLLQNVPGLIARAPDYLAQLIGFTRDDLIAFFKRHNAIFQLHTDGTVTVKPDAVRALLNKNDNTQIITTTPTLTTTTPSPIQQQQLSSVPFNASGVVLRIFPKYGILNMDNNEQVFFDIQSCQFETFNDLTCVLNPGDYINFTAVLGPKEGSTKWKSLKTWTRENRPTQLMTPILSGNSNSSLSHIVHSASTNNLSSIVSSGGGYISPPSFDPYPSQHQHQHQHQHHHSFNGFDQELNAYQMGTETNGGMDESLDNNGIPSSPLALVNSTNSNRHSRLGLPPLDEEQAPLPKMAGGLDAEVLRRNLQQVVQRTNAISLREQIDETGRYVSQGCQTTSTGEILATNIHIE